jgi:iron only hydrogenase large subunit-like protein
VISPSEYWHLALYLITYILWIIAMVYAYIALDKVYDVRISTRNGADAYIWAGMLMAIFAFIGLTATGTGRLSMNIMRTRTSQRVNQAESKINEHLPAIRDKVDTHLENIRQDVTQVKSKVDDIHQSRGLSQDNVLMMSEQNPAAQTISQMNCPPGCINSPSAPQMPRSMSVSSSLAAGRLQ